MRSLGFALVIPVLLVAVVGCSTSQLTPPEVDAEFEALLETVDLGAPGESIAQLTEFRSRNEEYDIVAEVDIEIDRLLSVADGRYSEARELAREGEFERAEAMLQDLATHVPETSAGESAREHLAFDFRFGQAQWLMVRQRWDESAAVARPLLDRELTRAQRDEVEALLDNAGHVGAAYSQATRTQARVACRHIVILLQMMYAEEGRYPAQLSLADVEEWDPMGSRSVLRSLSAIEDYASSNDGYSFTAVGAENGHRIRVVDGVIAE